MTEERLAYSVKEVAVMCGVDPPFVYAEIGRGNLHAKRMRDNKGRPSRRLLLLRHDVDQWLEQLPDEVDGF